MRKQTRASVPAFVPKITKYVNKRGQVFQLLFTKWVKKGTNAGIGLRLCECGYVVLALRFKLEVARLVRLLFKDCRIVSWIFV